MAHEQGAGGVSITKKKKEEKKEQQQREKQKQQYARQAEENKKKTPAATATPTKATTESNKGGGGGSFSNAKEVGGGGGSIDKKDTGYRSREQQEYIDVAERNERKLNQATRPVTKITPKGTQITSTPNVYDPRYTPSENREIARSMNGLPISDRSAYETVWGKGYAAPTVTGRERFKAEQTENVMLPTVNKRTKKYGIETTAQENPSRVEQHYAGHHRLPQGNDKLSGSDWQSKAAGEEFVYNINGRRVTESDLRAQGYSEEVLYRLRALANWKTAPRKDQLKQIGIEMQSAGYSPDVHMRNVIDSFRSVEDKIVSGDFADDRDRSNTFAQYDRLKEEYYRTLSGDSLEQEIRRTEELLAQAKTKNTATNDIVDPYRLIGRQPGQTGADVRAGQESVYNTSVQDNTTVAVLENKLAALRMIQASRQQAELLDRIRREGDYDAFAKWYALQTQVGTEKTNDVWEGVANALSGTYSAGIADPTQDERQRAVYDELNKVATALKKKGYSAEDFRLFDAYKDNQIYQQQSKGLMDYVNAHPVAGPLAAAGLQVVTSPVRGISRIVSDMSTGGMGYQAEKGLTTAVKEATQQAAQNIERTHGKVWSKVYQYSVSAAESFLMGTTLGPATSVVMGMNAAVDAYDEALERGIDRENAVALGITSGIFEALFEYISLDKIKWIDKKTAKSVALTFAKDALIEGTEEVTTDLANEIADYLLAGGLSKYNTARANGMTAEQYAAKFGMELLDSFIGGTFGGVAFGLAKGARSGFHVGEDTVKNVIGDVASGKSINKYGDVTALIDEAKASGDTESIKLADKLEAKLADGKRADRLAGQLYNRMQGNSVQQAATQRFKEIAEQKGVTIEEWEAEEAGRGIAAAANRTHLSEKQAKVLDGDIGQQLYEEARDGAEWFETNRGERLDFARRTGAVNDRAGREMRTAEAVARRAQDVTKAIREGNSYTLVKDGFAGQYVGKEGQRSEAKLGGIDSIGEHNELMVVVDDDGKGGPHATAAFSVGEDAAEGTVQAADADTEILYLDAQAYLTGNADMAEPEQYGADYQYKDGATMSVAAANTALATYDSRVNPDAHGFMAWFFDAHKAGKSGVSWERYLSLYNQQGAAEWSGYITEDQLREAFRTGQMEFAPQNGVTRIGNRQLTNGEGAFLQVLDYVAKKLHFAIVAADDIDGKNGFVSSRADVAVISLDADAGRFMTAAFHEIHHLISRELGTTAGRQFTAAVLDTYRTVVGKQRFNEDLAHYEDLYKNEFSAEDRTWKVREEMAAQYFGNVAEDNIELLVKRIDQTGGKKLLAKVVDAIKAFRDAISEALQHLAGIDPATRAAADTNAKDARKLFDRFIAEAERTMEARETALAEKGEVLRTAAENAEFGTRERETPSVKVEQENPALYTLNGSKIQRSNKGVGKQMGSQIYVHKDYADEIVPHTIYEKAKALLPSDFFYNTIMYDTKIPNVVRFDEAPNFDTAREPIPGRMMKVDVRNGEVTPAKGNGNMIWHHKWMWVRNDYTGFDVAESYNWSKTWLQKITNPSGSLRVWNEALREHNLPVDNEEVLTNSLRVVEPIKPTSNAWQSGHSEAWFIENGYPIREDVSTEWLKAREAKGWKEGKKPLEKKGFGGTRKKVGTQIPTTKPTYTAIYDYLQEKYPDTWQNIRILDASSGYGLGTLEGLERGFNVTDIEPIVHPTSDYMPDYMDYSSLQDHVLNGEVKPFDFIISNAVLNVIPQDTRDAMVKWFDSVLAPGGTLFVNTLDNTYTAKAKTITQYARGNAGNESFSGGNSNSVQKGFHQDELKAYIQDGLGSGYTVDKPDFKAGSGAVIVAKKNGRNAAFDTAPYTETSSYKSLKGATAEELSTLSDAKQLLENGADSEEVRKRTGWFKGLDGKWRIEIDDSKMKLLPFNPAAPPALDQLIDHRELFQAYPFLRETTVFFLAMKNANGRYNKGENSIDLNKSIVEDAEKLKETLIHEIQHAIQLEEGLSAGASPSYWQKRINNKADNRSVGERKMMEEASADIIKLNQRMPEDFGSEMWEWFEDRPTEPRGNITNWDTLEAEPDPPAWKAWDKRGEELSEKYGEDAVAEWLTLRERYENLRKNNGSTNAESLYYHTAGEIEARDAAARVNLTAEERQNTRPDIDRTDVVFADGGERETSSRKVTDTDYLVAVERGDMDEAQRMVDEAAQEWGAYPEEDGNPRKFYHGTNSGRFTVFDRKLIGAAREGDVGFFGRGFYFAFHQGEASMYGRNVIDAYLRMKKPFNFIKELTTYNGERTSIYGASDAVFVINFAEKFPTLAKNHFVEVAKKGSDSVEKISLAEFAKQFRDVYQHKEFSVQDLDGYNGKEWHVYADRYTETFTGSDGKEHSFTDYHFERPFYDELSARNKLNQTYEYLSNAVYSYLHLPRMVDVIQETDFSGELQKRGYDGLVQSEQGDEAVVFNENQIKSADPVTYDDDGNVIPLSERFDEEKEDIRWSKKVTDARAELAERTLGRDELGQMLDETAKFLQQARKTVDKAEYDAWIQGLRTGGRVPQRTALLKVVRQYNDPKVTGESNEALADRIVERLADMTDAEYSVDALIYTLVDAMYRRAAATEMEDTTNEARNVIREVTQGRKYYINDGEFNYLVEHTAGTRRGMNEVFRRVYGFTLFPQSEAERRGATDGIGSIPGELQGQRQSWQYEQDEGDGNLWAILGGNYDEDVKDAKDVSVALQLYELRDDMLPEARTMEDDVRDQMKKEAPDAQTREQWVAETIYEEAYQDAARFAEDIIRLSPMRTLADAYEGTMEELRQAAKGVLAKRAKEIEAIAERLGAAEVTLGRAGEMSEEQRAEIARLERQVKNLEDQMSLARAAAEKAKAADAKDAAKLQAKVDDVSAKLKDAQSALAKERAKVRRRDKQIEAQKHAVREARYAGDWEVGQQKLADDIYYGRKLNATRQYYIQKRHEESVKRADTASRQRKRQRIRTKVRWLNDRLTSPTEGKYIPPEMRDGIAAFVKNFLQEDTTAKGNSSLFTAEQLLRLNAYYGRLQTDADGWDSFFDEDVAEIIRRMSNADDELSLIGKRLADLTRDQLAKLEEVIDNLVANVRNANKMFGNMRNRMLSADGDRFISQIDHKQPQGRLAEIYNNLRTGRLNMNMIKPIWLFKDVLGGEIERYFTDLQHARNQWVSRAYIGRDYIKAKKQQYNYNKWYKKKNSFTLDDGSAVTLTKDAVLQIYATWMRERQSITPTNHLKGGGIVLEEDLQDLQKKKNLTKEQQKQLEEERTQLIDKKAHSLTQNDIDTMLATLTDEQKDYADDIVRFLSTTVAGWGNETSRELSGFDKFTEGYYFPYQSSGLYQYHQMGVSDDTRLKNAGFTKALTMQASTPIVITGFSEVAGKHVIDMANYSTLALPLENMHRLVNYRNRQDPQHMTSVQASLNEVFGEQMFAYIRRFLNQMNGGVKRDSLTTWSEKLFSGFKRSAVAMNISVIAQQPSAIARAMALVNPKYFVATTAHWFDWKELQKYSGVAKIKAMGSWDINTGKSTVDFVLGNSSAMDKWNQFTGKGAELADAITWSHIWNAVKRETAKKMGLKYKRKGMSEAFYEAAAERFDEVADYTQVYDATITRSQWMRSEDGRHKIMTQFMAEPITSYNLLMFSGMKKNGNHINKVAAVTALICNIVLNTALQSLVGAWRDKEKKSYWERYFKKFIEGVFGTRQNSFLDSELNVANMIPFVQDVMSMLQGWDNTSSDMSLIADLIKSFNNLKEKFEKRDDDEALRDFITDNNELVINFLVSAFNFSPLPAKTIYRDFVKAPMNAIDHIRNGGYKTAAQHIADIWKQNFEGEWDKNEQLYNAVIRNDREALAEYTKVTDADIAKYVNEANDEFSAAEHARNLKEKDFHEKVQEALKAIDSRIEDAARALLDYDYATVNRLTDAIEADGFDRNDVVKAIKSTSKAMKPPTEYEDSDISVSYFAETTDMKDLVEAAMRDGYGFDTAVANAVKVRDQLQDQGKNDKDIDSETQEPINEKFIDGSIDLDEAIRLYKSFTTINEEGIMDRLTDRVYKRYEADEDMTLEDARQMYEALGMKEDKIANNMGKLIVSDYSNKKLTDKEAAVKLYMEYTGEEESTATISFDYYDLKASDETFPLEYSAYKTYREKGLAAVGITVDTYASYLSQTDSMDGSTANDKQNAFAHNQGKFGNVQAQILPVIDKMDLTVKQKDALYLARWAEKYRLYAPWHNPGYWSGLLD